MKDRTPGCDSLQLHLLEKNGIKMTNHMSIDEWIDYGVERGYAEKFCYMHDSSPMEEWEAVGYDDGEDPCIPTLRVWLDQEQSLPSSPDPNTQQPFLFE